MKKIQIGHIASIILPDGWLWDKGADGISLTNPSTSDKVRISLFQKLPTDAPKWCKDKLEDYVRNDIGPPYETSVLPIESDDWRGYQGVTRLEGERYLVNRIIASRDGRYGARIEFDVLDGKSLDQMVEMVESLVFAASLN